MPKGDAVFLLQLTASADDLAARANKLIEWIYKAKATVDAANDIKVDEVKKQK